MKKPLHAVPSIGTPEAQWWSNTVLPRMIYPAAFAAWHWENEGFTRAQQRLRERLAYLYEIDARMRGFYLFGAPLAWLDEEKLNAVLSGADETFYEDESQSPLSQLWLASHSFGICARRLERGKWRYEGRVPFLHSASEWTAFSPGATLALCFDLSLPPNTLWRDLQRYKAELPPKISRRKFIEWIKSNADAKGVLPRPSRAKTGEDIPVNWDVLKWWDKWHVEKLKGESFKAHGRLNRLHEGRTYWQTHLSIIAAWSRFCERDEKLKPTARMLPAADIFPARPIGSGRSATYIEPQAQVEAFYNKHGNDSA